MAVLSLAALMLALPLHSSAAGVGSARLDLHECYDMLLEQPAAVPSSSSSSSSSQQLPVNCEGSQGGPRGMDTCFLLCGFCAVPSLRFGLSVPSRELYCGTPPSSSSPPNATQVALAVSSALVNASVAHGYMFRAPNVTADLAHLLGHMNRADLQALFAQPMLMIDFLSEHLRFALRVQGRGVARNVSREMWLEYVLPFGFLDEKRDLYWRWRPTFYKTFAADPTLAAATTITEAVHALTSLIPHAQMQGVVAIACVRLACPVATSSAL
jgi:hypothetical protein